MCRNAFIPSSSVRLALSTYTDTVPCYKYIRTPVPTAPITCVFVANNMTSASGCSVPSHDLFQGTALLSPFVPRRVQDLWGAYRSSYPHLDRQQYICVPGAHGGAVATGDRKATHVFCRDMEDPWLPKLLHRAIPVFHMKWINDSVAWGFLRPINHYVLDGRRRSRSSILPGEDSQATLCASEDSILQDEQLEDLPSSQTLVDFAASSTTVAKRKGSPEGGMFSSGRPRKTARIAHFDHEADSITSSTPHTKHSAKTGRRTKATPYLDLRRVAASAGASALEYEPLGGFGARKVAAASSELRQLMEDSDASRPRVSVAVALNILCDVPTDNAVKFIPGHIHEGKDFRCKFVSRSTKAKVKN
ncbi:uncharacterized protein B0H18DRAFT_994090 [Fomitopsis serialis]|uniref:uncharacterized protein n=1 Tax=Fomitopsis serialis TaxID=139415 RepID=UPI0020077FD0|nr:uncharacterized protein B0H18DRAFT_994090 [Neoantrodia serialis]KAH9930267.1 hypothetical protein B0H18DRAFT_994090 [Neoantrodia serialis]